jgi:hypothetical protein
MSGKPVADLVASLSGVVAAVTGTSLPCEETSRDIASQTAKRDLIPHGRVALEPGDGDQVEVQDCKLSEFRNRRLEYDVRGFRVDADREVVERDVDHVLPNVLSVSGVIGQRLQVRDQHGLLVIPLKRYAGS